MQGLKKKCYSLPHQPGFLYGAPAEFVNLSILSPDVEDLAFDRWLTSADCISGAGLVHSFAVSSAVAHYQGKSSRYMIGNMVNKYV